MISNVNLNASAHMQNVSKQPDEKLQSESNSVAAVTSGKSDENAIVDVFTVSFWDRGVPQPEAKPIEAATSVDITVDGGIYLDTSAN